MSDTTLSVTWLRSATEIAPSLWESCFPPPLEGRWWYTTLERSHLDDQFTFFYGLVTLDNRMVAIAPTFLMDLPIGLVVPPNLLPLFNLLGKIFPSLLYQRTLFVGSPCADEGQVGMLPGVDRLAVLRALQEALRQQVRIHRASMLVWKDFPASFDADFARLLPGSGLFPVVSFPGTLVDLPGESKAAYLASLTGMRRHNLQKKLRRSAEQVAIDIQVEQFPDTGTLDAVFALFSQTYDKAKTRFERLGRPFFAQIATQPQAHFIILREHGSGEMVAFMLCFAFDALVINKFIGIDYRRPKGWYLYFRLWEAVVDWAVARGAKAIQSGQTGYAAKIRLGHRLVALTNYAQHRNPLMHRIYAAVARTVGWQTLDDDLALHLKAHPDGE
ncbi:MAG: N-acetyltransferase [Magnetococcales bacterium]|nr:N-acetyltransferase [Magnetococcales bacterium]